MNSLEERQKEWDEKYDNPTSQSVKSRPARPSKKEDEQLEKMEKSLANTPWNISNKKDQDDRADIRRAHPREEEQAFIASRSDGGKLNYILTNLLHQEIDFELKRCIGDRSVRIVSLTKETPYGIAHFDIQISISEIANDRLANVIEQGLSDIHREEKALYEKRRDLRIPNSQDFFNRKY